MAQGSYKSVNLTKHQKEFLILLDENEIDIFSLMNIEKLLGIQFANLNEILENLADKKLLSRIERGKYCRHNFRDENVISQYLTDDGVIAYWSALSYYGMTEQFPNIIFVQTKKKKNSKKVFGVMYKFIKVSTKKYLGITNEGYGNHQFRITDPEKTLIDCFDLPKYAGGYSELIRAFTWNPSIPERLIEYSSAVNNLAAIKRMGYLAELFAKEKLEKFVDFAKRKVNPKYNLFDPFGPDKGEFISNWKLRLNISKGDIITICQK